MIYNKQNLAHSNNLQILDRQLGINSSDINTIGQLSQLIVYYRIESIII